MASAQNPVLSKLLMADQDGPLDLSVKKNQDKPEPRQQGEGNMHAHTHISKKIMLKPALKSGCQVWNPAQTQVQFQEVMLVLLHYISEHIHTRTLTQCVQISVSPCMSGSFCVRLSYDT